MSSSDDRRPPETRGSDDNLRGLDILLVEDSQSVGDALKQHLELLGATVTGPAATTAEATKLMTERSARSARGLPPPWRRFLWLNCATSQGRGACHHTFRLFRVSRASFAGGGDDGRETNQRSADSSISEADTKSRPVISSDDHHASARSRLHSIDSAAHYSRLFH